MNMHKEKDIYEEMKEAKKGMNVLSKKHKGILFIAVPKGMDIYEMIKEFKEKLRCLD